MGRRKRDKKASIFRLYPETHYSLFKLMEDIEISEVEQALELLLSTFRQILISANQFSKTANQLSDNCLSEKITANQLFISANQFYEICLSVIRHYREITGRQELPELLQVVEKTALQWGVSLQRGTPLVITRDPPRSDEGGYGGTNPLSATATTTSKRHKNCKIEISKEISIDKKNTRHSTYVECLGGLQDLWSFRPHIAEHIHNAIPITGVGNKSINSRVGYDIEIHTQYGTFGILGNLDRPEYTLERPIERQEFESAKNSEMGKNLYESSTYWETSTFSERMEEHRKRVAKVLQDKGLRWKLDRPIEVIKEWEREYGRWEEAWDEYLIELLRYFHYKRIVHRIRSFKFPANVEPSFPYIAVPVLKQIEKAKVEGKEIAETMLGDVILRQLRQKKESLNAKEIVKLWNSIAEKNKLLKKTHTTPSLLASIEQYLRIHKNKDFWERVFSFVPVAIKRTSNPEEPRDLGWLFRNTKSGVVIDWVLSLMESNDTNTKTEGIYLVYKKDIRKLRQLTGLSKEEFLDVLEKNRVGIVSRNTNTVGLKGENASSLASLLRNGDFENALKLLGVKQ